jgi:hypothetical protein
MRPTPDRFLDVLHASPAPAVQRLPQRFATLARTVTGGTDVVVRHDSAARAALAAVGKRAATIGNTIVLPERPGASTDIGVLAHELTHVAHPSPVPRFYADDHDSAEERQADAVAQLIRRSPTLRSPSSDASAPPIATSDLAARTPSNAPVLGAHRAAGIAAQLTPPPPRLSAPSVAPPARAAAGPGLARRVSTAGRPATSSSTSSSSGTVRRSTISSGSGSRPATTNHSTSAAPSSSGQHGGVVRRSTAAGAVASTDVVRRAITTGTVTEPPAQQQQAPLHDLIENLRSTGGVVDFVDWLVEQVEDRVVAEIQRRGGRYREDF